MKISFLSLIRRVQNIPRSFVLLALEILVLAGWTCFIGMQYLDFNPAVWPDGKELITNTQSHAMWVAFRRCGMCFLWNGSTNGGAPAFIEVYGAPFHPVVAASTLLFGFINGIKVTLLCSLFIAGLAQLWIGRILRLHPLARLWCAGVAVAGGHLSGRMDDGLVTMVLSTACCSLIIPALLQFMLSGSRKHAVVLGLSLASAILSGHGYMQIGFAVSVLPAFLVFGVLSLRPKPFPWRRLAVAVGLAMLLTAFLLVPLVHFLPLFLKESDPSLVTAQPLQYLPLNLVISDLWYFVYPDLGKTENLLFSYANFIGWIPVLLAVLACGFSEKIHRKTTLLFLASTMLVYLAAGAGIFRLIGLIDAELAGSVRYPSIIAGLAPPLILTMAGMGVHAIILHPWPTLRLQIRQRARGSLRIPLRALALSLLAAGMAVSLASAAAFGFNFYVARPAFKIPAGVLESVSTPEVEWVQTPYAEYSWFPAMMDRNIKIPVYFRPWQLRDPIFFYPRFSIVSDFLKSEVQPGWQLVQDTGEYSVYIKEDAYYAVLRNSKGEIPCTATGMWGELDVKCASNTAGVLELKENNYSGWRVEVDGESALLRQSQYLTVQMPAGTHTASFRYRPWDVPAGIILSVFGWILAAAYVRYGGKESKPERVGEEVHAPGAGG